MIKKIIVAEDDQMNRECKVCSLERICKREGIEASVEGVPDGKPLVEKVKEGNYDLIFTDNQMLEVHGLMAIKQIREFNKDVPIYMLTGSGVKKEAMECGATGHIGKGDDNEYDLIEEAIRTHLK